MVKITFQPEVKERQERAMYYVTIEYPGKDTAYYIYVIRRHYILVDTEHEEPREVFNGLSQAIEWIKEKYKDHIVSCDFLDIKVKVVETKTPVNEKAKQEWPKYKSKTERDKAKMKYYWKDPVTGHVMEMEVPEGGAFEEELNKAYKGDYAEKHTFDPYDEASEKMREAMNEFKKAFSNNPKLTEEAKIKHARKQWFNGWFQEWSKMRSTLERLAYPQWLTEEVKRTAPYTQYEVDKAKLEAGFAQQQRRADEREKWDKFTYIRHMFAFDKEFGTGKQEQKSKWSDFTFRTESAWRQAHSNQHVRTSEDEVKVAYNAYLYAKSRAEDPNNYSFIRSRFDTEKMAYYNRYQTVLSEYLKNKRPETWSEQSKTFYFSSEYTAPCGAVYVWNPYKQCWQSLGAPF